MEVPVHYPYNKVEDLRADIKELERIDNKVLNNSDDGYIQSNKINEQAQVASNIFSLVVIIAFLITIACLFL